MTKKTSPLPRILFVDDEANLLEGVSVALRRHFEVVTAISGVAALALMKVQEPFAVVVADMRMPVMNGAAFLSRAREEAPDMVRILLTGQTDLESAITAVNQGGIFRFLSKPCQPDLLLNSLQEAIDQHHLLTAERVLLEETLHGCIQTLTDVLALSQPTAYGKVRRAQQRVGRLAASLKISNRWEVEVAAMLSQIACVTLPPSTVAKQYLGQPLDDTEQDMIRRLPLVTDLLLANIPRIEGIRTILRHQGTRFDGAGGPESGLKGGSLPWGARALKIALDFDELEAQGMRTSEIHLTLQERQGWYDPHLLKAFIALFEVSDSEEIVRLHTLAELKNGMIFAEDVCNSDGAVLVARGHVVTAGLLARLKNFSFDKLSFRVSIPSPPEPLADPVPALATTAPPQADGGDRSSP